MTTIIIALAILSMLHFVYDGIILPSIRLYLRNELFELRDELRRFKIDSYVEEESQAFDFLHDGVNNFLNSLPVVSLVMVFNVSREIERNDKLRKKAKQRLNTIEKCENQDLKDIYKRVNYVVLMAFVSNTGLGLIYILPVAIIYHSYSRLKVLIKDMLAMPSSDANRLIPQT